MSTAGFAHATGPRTTVTTIEADEAGESLAEWGLQHRDQVDAALLDAGAICFRGFGVDDLERFEAARDVFLPATTPYVERATPRKAFGNEIFSSTEFPASEEIALHNENSYAMTWPGRLMFGCITAPEVGGATPVADVRRVLDRLPSRAMEAFVREGWCLVRNYGSGFGLPWQEAFGTDDKDAVTEYCSSNEIDSEWLDDDRLRTRQLRPALARHPETGDIVWFNHIRFWHASMLADELRELLVEEFGEDGLPYNTYFGNGEPIPAETAAAIAAAYDSEKVATPWEPGNVLLVDNMLAAHGREPYSGERRVLVSMGITRHRAECNA
jgi:alpha-ketoglutarate-dependent taurine dioxygenase